MHLINAREALNDPMVQDVTRRGLDLDEGMVIIADGNFYHGKDALKLMARYGTARNIFTAFCKAVFWSDWFSSITYPWMRGARNFLLKLKGVGRIDNLKKP